VSVATEVDPQVIKELSDRGIKEVRHFTTNRGLLGTLSEARLLSRRHLQNEEVLRLIAMNNCYRRFDPDWYGHVSLSIERINAVLFGISSGNWHSDDKDIWWAVLGFDSEILAHPGVIFSTTNNGHSITQREAGREGLRALYGEQVVTWRNGPRTVVRTSTAPNRTTCPQAEALYPDAVDTSWLRCVYVRHHEHADTIQGWFAATDHRSLPVVVDLGAFI
jgi:ssDNA thymidine ADP-ribosyltransferase, DarT